MTPNYRIIRSNRKTVAIEVTPQGEVILRCPRQMRRQDILLLLECRQEWIHQQLQKLQRTPILPPLSQQELTALRLQAKTELPERVSRYAASMGVTYGKITIRCQRTLWGSCSAAGNLSFNCLIMLMPREVVDYLIVHELCHRKEMNHSPRFWSEVTRVLPDYAVQKKWLRENGSALLGRLPE